MLLKKIRFCVSFLLVVFAITAKARAGLIIDDKDIAFSSSVTHEVSLMKDGKRGLPCQELIQRIENAVATTTIKPITRDESTWHPNDPKGVRSHVEPLDTKVRGGNRTSPTSAVLYLNPDRVNPDLSVYKLGTFAHELAIAMDMNTGQFSGNYQLEERRATFFRNAWRDSLGLSLFEISDRVPTPEYRRARDAGLLVPENRQNFPILTLPPRPK